MENTDSQPAATQGTPELLYLFGSAPTNGLTYGSRIDVPEGYAGVVVMNNRAYDAVRPGEYSVDARYFPQIAQKLRLQPGQMPSKPVQISVYLVNISGASLRWSAQPVVTKNREHGLTYCELRGQCSVRVINPASFYNAFVSGWSKILKKQPAAVREKFAATTFGQQAAAYVRSTIAGAATLALGSMSAPPDQIMASPALLGQSIGSAAAAALRNIGLELTGFEISNAPTAHRAPCAKCGSTTAPTAYGIYRRTISMLYIRFGAKREGNFCVPCAAKVSAAYNGVMLVCGWWGYVGIVLTPIYLVQNCYNFLRTAFGPKAASHEPVFAPPQEGSMWPPAPDWGREVQES